MSDRERETADLYRAVERAIERHLGTRVRGIIFAVETQRLHIARPVRTWGADYGADPATRDWLLNRAEHMVRELRRWKKRTTQPNSARKGEPCKGCP